jgi:hypothetical protein
VRGIRKKVGWRPLGIPDPSGSSRQFDFLFASLRTQSGKPAMAATGIPNDSEQGPS